MLCFWRVNLNFGKDSILILILALIKGLIVDIMSLMEDLRCMSERILIRSLIVAPIRGLIVGKIDMCPYFTLI